MPYTISVCLDTDSTMPISPSSINKLVPPDEKNGRLMPVFGIVFVTTAMFRIACSVTCTTNPTTKSGRYFLYTGMLIPAAWFVRITISVLPMRRTQMNGDPRIMGDCIIPLRLPHPVWS